MSLRLPICPSLIAAPTSVEVMDLATDIDIRLRESWSIRALDLGADIRAATERRTVGTAGIPARQAWICPSDRGYGKLFQPTTANVLGDSYRFNWVLAGDYSGVGEEPFYNLGLKKESWVSEPTRFIMFYDMAVYPYTSGNGTVEISQWHNTANAGKVWNTKTIKSNPEKMVGTIGFVDGHVDLCDFSVFYENIFGFSIERRGGRNYFGLLY